MPEGRMLKKVISESKSLGNLPSDSARLLYTWLIPWLDIEGRHSGDPEIIKGHIFPKIKSMTNKKIAGLLVMLAEAKLIVLYQEDGEIYLEFKKFKQHQSLKIDREAPSKIPSPKSETVITPANSGVHPENAVLSKDNISKDKLSKVKAENTGSLFEEEFNEFWKNYPREGRHDKKGAWAKFASLCKKDRLKDIIKATNNYTDFLKRQRNENNFQQRPMYAKTFLNGRFEDFVDIKIEPRL